MTIRSDHSHQRNLRHWIAGGFVVLAVIFCARYHPVGEFGDRREVVVVVAKQEIPLGEKITAEQVAFAQIPYGSVPEGAFSKLDEVIGRVAITPIGVRETITNIKLAPSGVGAGLSAVIPEGYRAMTVKVDDVVGVSGFIMPGSFVDVVAIITPLSQAGGAHGPISKIVLEKIKVLARGAKIEFPQNQPQPSETET